MEFPSVANKLWRYVDADIRDSAPFSDRTSVTLRKPALRDVRRSGCKVSMFSPNQTKQEQKRAALESLFVERAPGDYDTPASCEEVRRFLVRLQRVSKTSKITLEDLKGKYLEHGTYFGMMRHRGRSQECFPNLCKEAFTQLTQ